MRFDAIHEGPPLSQQRLDDYLTRFGITVPLSLRTQLLEQNGGSTREDYFVDVNGSDEGFSALFGFDTPGDGAIDLDTVIELTARRLPRTPCHSVPTMGGTST